MKKGWFWSIFLIGFAIRLALIPWASSYFSTELFIPFLDSSLEHFGQNPWALSDPRSFPYGSILYLILIGPKAVAYGLFGSAALGSGWLGMSLYKLPILMSDTILFMALARYFFAEKNRLLVFYWLNPIVIYVSYFLGHIDIIPMAFITLSCLFLFRGNVWPSALFGAFAVASKFHTAIAIPLILLFIWRNEFWPRVIYKLALWCGVFSLTTFCAMILPFKANHLGYITTASPEAMRLFSLSLPLGNGISLYLGFAFVLIVLGRLLVTNKVTEQGLFYGLGILFSSLVLGTSPFPNWYLWLVPFCVVFAAQYRLIHFALPVFHVAFFFIYFLLPTSSEKYLFLASVSLTILQGTVAAYLALMWFFVAKKEFPLSGRLRPMIIGIAGDSGAGKNRLSDALSKVFDVRQNSSVEGDDYHKWERGNQNWTTTTHLSPKANFLDTMSSHTLSLSSGRSVLQPRYDHTSGQFTDPKPYKPSQTIIVQGLHTLYPRSMRDVTDLKVFINPHPLVRLSWKIDRDVKHRGYSIERVLASIRQRAADGEKYIEPQRLYADWIIEAFSEGDVSESAVIQGEKLQIKMRHIMWNDLPISSLVESLAEIKTVDVNLHPVENDIDRISLTVSGSIEAFEVGCIAKRLFPYLRSLTRTPSTPIWERDFDGINQLIALTLLNWKEIRETLR